MEDGSIQISEKEVKDSALPAGKIIKRHKIPKSKTELIGLDDLEVRTVLF